MEEKDPKDTLEKGLALTKKLILDAAEKLVQEHGAPPFEVMPPAVGVDGLDITLAPMAEGTTVVVTTDSTSPWNGPLTPEGKPAPIGSATTGGYVPVESTVPAPPVVPTPPKVEEREPVEKKHDFLIDPRRAP